MIKKPLLAVVALAAVVLAGAVYAQNPPVSPSPVKRNIVSKLDVPGSNYEVLTANLEIAPGFKAGRHFHPGVVSGYITEGEFWLAIDGQPEKVYKAGESFEIPSKAVHNEGAGDKPMKLVAVYVIERGQALVTPVK